MSQHNEPKEAGEDRDRTGSFLGSVLWSWLPVACNLFTGFVLTPYLIRCLGDDRFGIWGLSFSFLEYASFFDLGLRSAVVNQASRLNATGQRNEVIRVINTALLYFIGVGLGVIWAAWMFHGQAHVFFRVQDVYAREFDLLMLLVGVGLASSLVAAPFSGTLEALGEFRAVNQNQAALAMLRVVVTTGALYLGYGLLTIGVVVVGAQLLTYALNWMSLKRVLPGLHISPKQASWVRFKEMLSFGLDSLMANVAQIFLNQGPLSIIKRLGVSEASVGYYSAPLRLFTYGTDAIARIGFVTSPSTASMEARGEREQLIRMGMYLNRYCFALFMPLSLFLWFWGTEFLRRWLGEGFAVEGGPLLPPFIVAYAVALGGQFNSSSMLFGMAKHRSYAVILMIEAVLLAVGVWNIWPRFGLLGVAYCVSTLMILSRGIATPVLLCRYLDFSFFKYWFSIYTRPLLAAAPVAMVAWLLSKGPLQGRSWMELVIAGAVTSVLYAALAVLLVPQTEHRQRLMQVLAKRLGRA
jgi:O-antigen/teichoic acid export membrane protein